MTSTCFSGGKDGSVSFLRREVAPGSSALLVLSRPVAVSGHMEAHGGENMNVRNTLGYRRGFRDHKLTHDVVPCVEFIRVNSLHKSKAKSDLTRIFKIPTVVGGAERN